MAQQIADVLDASPADLAADMSYHRHTYLRFLKLMKWVAIGSALVLIVVFLLLY